MNTYRLLVFTGWFSEGGFGLGFFSFLRMKIGDGKQMSRFHFLLSLRAPHWGCLETATVVGHQCLPRADSSWTKLVPYSLPETQGAGETSCFITELLRVEKTSKYIESNH